MSTISEIVTGLAKKWCFCKKKLNSTQEAHLYQTSGCCRPQLGASCQCASAWPRCLRSRLCSPRTPGGAWWCAQSGAWLAPARTLQHVITSDVYTLQYRDLAGLLYATCCSISKSVPRTLRRTKKLGHHSQ